MPETFSTIIRQTQSSDQSAINEVRKRSWEAAYKNLLPPELIAEATQPKVSRRVFKNISEEILSSRISFLAENKSGEVLGFVAGGLSRDSLPDVDAELWAIYVDPEFHSKGIGKVLFQRFITEMKNRNHHSMIVWVLSENHSARKFYEAMGGILYPKTKYFNWDDRPIAEESAYVWRLK